MERVLICSHDEAIGLKVLYCLRAAGFHVDMISIARKNATRFSRYLRRFHVISQDIDSADISHQVVGWINDESTHRKWLAILADDIYSHGFLHSLRTSLNVPTFAPTGPRLLEACHDKWSFYCTLVNQGLSTPMSYLVEDPNSLTHDVVQRIGYPVLVKPLAAQSGHGIRIFEDFASIAEYLKSPGPYKELPLIIQHFIRGHTVGLSLLATEGRIHSYDVQLHSDDGSRVFYDDPEVAELGRRIVAAFDYGGPAHIDLVRDDYTGALYALEFNCRFWYSVTVSTWRGGNFPALAVKLARGESIPEAPTSPGAYFQPLTVVQNFSRPRNLTKLDVANWKGFWQTISDPVPHLVNKFF